MAGKTITLCLGASVLLFMAASMCFADATADLGRADRLTNDGYYSQAEGIYTAIVQNNPRTDSALNAQAKIVIIRILTGRDADAKAGLDKLTTDFAGNAGLPAVLYGIAQRYKAAWKTAEADKIFQQLAAQYPSTYQADKIQLVTLKDQILRAISDGRMSDAKAGIDNVTANFSSNSAIGATLYSIAREYKENERFDEAKDIYQRIVQQCPTSSFAAKARLGIAKMTIWQLIRTGKITEANTAVDSFVIEFKDSPEFVAAYHGIAIRYGWSKNYDEAKNIFQRIIQQYPDSSESDKAKIDIVKCQILSLFDVGNNDAAMAAVDKLMADFGGDSYLPKVLSEIAQQRYYVNFAAESKLSEADRQANFLKAAAVWEIVINRLPSSAATAEACCYTADTYNRLGQYAKSAGYCQKVIDDFSSCPRIWNAYFLIGRDYEELKKAGTVSTTDADVKIRYAYQQLVEKYTDYTVTKYAQQWLSR